MSEMVERVARALAKTRVYEGYNAETKARLIEHEMYRARHDARAAIEAMREPAHEMVAAARKVQLGTTFTAADLGKLDAAIYTAMIDAALKD